LFAVICCPGVVAERSFGFPVRAAQQLAAHARSIDDSHEGYRLVGLEGVAEGVEHRAHGSPVQWLEVQMDRPSAGEPDAESLLVAVAERDKPPVLLLDHLQRGGDDGALDAAARDRADDVAVLIDRHGGSRITRTRPLHTDHPSDGDALALLPPSYELAHDLLHVFLSHPAAAETT